MKIISNKHKPYYTKDNGNLNLFHGDSLELLKDFKSESVDMIFADPPYFLSNDGVTCQSGKMVKVNKGKWDVGLSPEDMREFNKNWLSECKRILKQNGTIFVSGTSHNIYNVGFCLQELGYKIINDIAWFKINPPPPKSSPALRLRPMAQPTHMAHQQHWQPMRSSPCASTKPQIRGIALLNF
jgi:site-specific DNA-methyltransferase (adenine-specific)